MATESEFYPKDDHSWKTWMFQEYLQASHRHNLQMFEKITTHP
jgi:hypothetical protein